MRTSVASLLSLFLVLSLSLQNCQKTQEPSCGQIPNEYYSLKLAEKSKVPYRLEKFDTISFTSDEGDTLIFTRQTLDSGTNCFERRRSIICPPNYICAEYYGSDYLCIKGQGKFEFKHGKALDIVTNSPTNNIREYPNVIEFRFNETHFIFGDYNVDDQNSTRYIGDTTIKGITYHSCIYGYHEFQNSAFAKVYYNKEFGLFHIQDKKNNKNWTIIEN